MLCDKSDLWIVLQGVSDQIGNPLKNATLRHSHSSVKVLIKNIITKKAVWKRDPDTVRFNISKADKSILKNPLDFKKVV